MTAKSFRIAIMKAMEDNPYDPAIKDAVEVIAEGFENVSGLLKYLWEYPYPFGWGARLGLEHSSKKQEALWVLTRKSWREVNR
jgi:hypothetical protein